MSPVRLTPRAFVLALALAALSSPARSQNSFAEDIHATEPARNPAPRETSGSSKSATFPSEKAAPSDPRFAKVAVIETQDFRVPPIEHLRADPLHAETPTSLPGGRTIGTEQLNAFYQREPGSFLIFDVLGGRQGLPGAQNALPAGRGASFNDAVQRDFGNYLQQVTQGRKDVPLVFYCQSVYCWMSYNAALRAVRLGYTQVFWYRGGLEAWQAAGLPVATR